MTLVLAIKYSEGVLLMSDKQGERTIDGVQQPPFRDQKYVFDKEKKIAIVDYGHANNCRAVMHTLLNEERLKSENIKEVYFEVVEKLSKNIALDPYDPLPKLDPNHSFSFLIVVNDSGKAKVYRAEGKDFFIELPMGRLFEAGGQTSRILPRLSTIEALESNFQREDAILFGVNIIDYIAKEHGVTSVGSLEQFGMDCITIPNQGEIVHEEINDMSLQRNILRCICELYEAKKVRVQ